MKRPNITPGNWKTRNSGGKTIVCREDSQAVGIPLDVCRVWQSSFTEANARAIAAIPDTHAALELALSELAHNSLSPAYKAVWAALLKAGYTFD